MANHKIEEKEADFDHVHCFQSVYSLLSGSERTTPLLTGDPNVRPFG